MDSTCINCGALAQSKNKYYLRKYCDNCRYIRVSEIFTKMNKEVIRAGSLNGMFGRGHSAESKLKMSKTRKANIQNGTIIVISGEQHYKFGKKRSEEEKQHLSDVLIKRYENQPHHLKGRKISDEHKAKIAANILKIKKETIPEKIVKEWLTNNNIRFIQEHQLAYYFFDFKIKYKKILIEVHGDFYHCNPETKHKDPKFYVQKHNLANDQRKKNFAENLGYKIVYIWEKDIKNNNFKALEGLIK